MDLTYPKQLAKEILQYSPPQVDNRFINADAWLLYKLGRYASQFPKFQELREDVFDEIKAFTGHSIVSELTLVRGNKHSVFLPLRPNMGAVFLEYGNMYGVKFSNDVPYERQVTMLKAYSPKLVNWYNDWEKSFGFQIDKPNLYTGAYTSIMNYDDCLFYVFGVEQ